MDGCVMTTGDERAFLELVQRIQPGATLRRAWNLTGGVSAQITALELELAGGQTVKLVVRRHGAVDRAANPRVARDEFRLLEIVRANGIVAPKPVFLDESCDLFPEPLLVIEFIDGDTGSAPQNPVQYVSRAATELARIHGVQDSPLLSFLPRQGRGFGTRPEVQDDSMQEGRIRDVLEKAWPVRQVNPDVLLHGDYWPGNLLWNDEQLAAVIDWEDARVGDPLSDLGNTRMEILLADGVEIMESFTAHYHSLTDIDLVNLPYWDLAAALRPCGRLAGWGLEPDVEARMRERHIWFVERSLTALSR
jgi:aminoglycoside phosphotransferase (APT) family kinase protein